MLPKLKKAATQGSYGRFLSNSHTEENQWHIWEHQASEEFSKQDVRNLSEIKSFTWVDLGLKLFHDMFDKLPCHWKHFSLIFRLLKVFSTTMLKINPSHLCWEINNAPYLWKDKSMLRLCSMSSLHLWGCQNFFWLFVKSLAISELSLRREIVELVSPCGIYWE